MLMFMKIIKFSMDLVDKFFPEDENGKRGRFFKWLMVFVTAAFFSVFLLISKMAIIWLNEQEVTNSHNIELTATILADRDKIIANRDKTIDNLTLALDKMSEKSERYRVDYETIKYRAYKLEVENTNLKNKVDALELEVKLLRESNQ